jgi:cytoskeletal protein RodZ
MKEIEGALLTLQRQLDPEGHFASPIPSGQMPIAAEALAPLPTRAPAPPTAVALTTESDESIEEPPTIIVPPIVAPPLNGPSKNANAGPSKPPTGTTIDQPANAGVRQPPAPQKVTPRSPGTSPKALVLILGLIGAVLVAVGGIGGWYWWKSHQAPAAVATATQPPAAQVPATPKPEPFPAVPAPVETTPTPPPAATTGTPDATAAKPKRERKPKPDQTAKTVPADTLPLAPPTPAPAPVTVAPPPPPPKPAPKPVVVTTPVMVSDALPFVMNLAEDVPADAPEGQALRFTVSEPLRIGDNTVIAKGAGVTGSVMSETGKKFLGIGGGKKLTFRLNQVEAVDGRKLAVRAMAGKSEDGPTIRPFETAKGSRPKGYAALQGTVYIGYIDGDQIVAVKK